MLQSALEYALAGISVFPLKINSKIPATPHGVKDATKDQAKVRQLWMQYPKSNVGWAMGAPSGIVGIDLDKGATAQSLKDFPRTVTVKTKNGWHLYFKYRDGLVNTHICKAQEKGYDATLRSTGYYFVGAGSVVDEHEYHYDSDAGGELSPEECGFAELPEWVLSRVLEKSKKVYGENSRHEMFKATAVAMRAKGHDAAAILSELFRRNSEDCNPPKPQGPELDKELQSLVDWAFKSVQENPAQVAERKEKAAKGSDGQQQRTGYVIPLGFGDDGTYFYTSSSNKTIVKLTASAHGNGGLLQLMPLEYWQAQFGDEKGNLNWKLAASDLMEACREQGIFDFSRVRGLGCWRSDTAANKMLIHLGDRLWVDGKECSLNSQPDHFTYTLHKYCETPNSNPLTDAECQKLLTASECLTWQDPSHAIFFAGAMALLRVSGALRWRPMLWITGASGTGKSTVMERVVNSIAGEDGVYILGNTTEAGIRQRLGASSQPVIFDEAETDDKRSNMRMKGVLELIRQASSDSQAQILKGTVNGKGHSFKVNSMFVLSSIQVNLTSVQDINRFTVVELRPGNPNDWPTVRSKLDLIDDTFGDRLFSRACVNFETLVHNASVLEDIIAAKTDRRTAQQYSALLAGYRLLSSTCIISAEEAEMLVSKVPAIADIHLSKTDSEQEVECLEWLMGSVVTVQIGDLKEIIQVGHLVSKATANEDYRECLNRLGMEVDSEFIFIANKYRELEILFRDTRWSGGLWGRSLSRLPGAKGSVQKRMRSIKPRCTALPISALSRP